MPDLEYYMAGTLARWGASALSAGATRATLAESTAGWMANQDVKDRLRDGAYWVLGVLSEAEDNDDRAKLLTTAVGIEHGVLLDDSIVPRVGEIASVRVTFDEEGLADEDYRSAEPDAYTRIEEYREDKADETSDVQMERYAYCYVKGRLYHTGSFAAVDYVPKITVENDDDLDELLELVPDRYASLVIMHAVQHLPIVTADSRKSAGSYAGSIVAEGRDLILKNLTPPPPDPEPLVPHEGG